MFGHLFNPRKRAASREFEVALLFLLHDAENLIPLLKRKYKAEWPSFIDDIVKGARPYEEAAVLIGTFLQDTFKRQDEAMRDTLIASIAANNMFDPPKILRIIGQVYYFLWLAEKGDPLVRENLFVIWLNDMSKIFTEEAGGRLSLEQCVTYLLALGNAYRGAKEKSVADLQADKRQTAR